MLLLLLYAAQRLTVPFLWCCFQIQLRTFQQAQEFPFLQETRHEMDGLKGELTEAKEELAKSQEFASGVQVRRALDVMRDAGECIGAGSLAYSRV